MPVPVHPNIPTMKLYRRDTIVLGFYLTTSVSARRTRLSYPLGPPVSVPPITWLSRVRLMQCLESLCSRSNSIWTFLKSRPNLSTIECDVLRVRPCTSFSNNKRRSSKLSEKRTGVPRIFTRINTLTKFLMGLK